MNQQHFVEQPEPQRMTHEEARAVVRLWSKSHVAREETDSPTVADVAEALEITPDEVERLLRSVQARRTGRPGRVRRAAAFVLSASLVVAAGLLLLPRSGVRAPAQVAASLPRHILYYENARFEATGSYVMVRDGAVLSDGAIRVTTR